MKIYTGKPRSGKSSLAVKYIMDNFIDPTAKDYKKYHNLYTNIGGFKHDLVNGRIEEYPIEIEDEEELLTKKSHKLDFDKFYVHLKYLHAMAKEDKSDEELLKYCKKHNINNSMLIIDECYRYFKKTSDPVLVWLLAYHGHLGMDIILIIHNLQLMHSDYKAFTETFIDAQPKNKGYSDNILRYFHYASEYYSADQKYETSTMKANPKIFELYKSGDIHKPKKIIYKYLAYLAILMIIILITWYILFKRFMEAPEIETEILNQSEKEVINNDLEVYNNELLNLMCNNKICTLTDTRKYKYYEYSLEYILFLTKKETLEVVYTYQEKHYLLNIVYDIKNEDKSKYLSSYFMLKKSEDTFSKTVNRGF